MARTPPPAKCLPRSPRSRCDPGRGKRGRAVRRTRVCAAALSAALAHGCRQWRLAEIECRALNDRSAFIDNEAESPVFGEEGQAMPAAVRIGPAFRPARDLASVHLLAELRQRKPEALGDHRCLDLNDAIP